MGQTEPNSQFLFFQIFADFCTFLRFLGITAFQKRRSSQKTAGNRRFSQKTAGNRRFLQKPFVQFSSSLLIPPYFLRQQTEEVVEQTLDTAFGA